MSIQCMLVTEKCLPSVSSYNPVSKYRYAAFVNERDFVMRVMNDVL